MLPAAAGGLSYGTVGTSEALLASASAAVQLQRSDLEQSQGQPPCGVYEHKRRPASLTHNMHIAELLLAPSAAWPALPEAPSCFERTARPASLDEPQPTHLALR